MNARNMAARVQLVAAALDDIGVLPLSLTATVYERGDVTIVVLPDDHQEVIDRLGLEPLERSDDVAVGTWADVRIWCQRYAREAAAS